ncbi:recombinase family protein [Roseovarius aestuarii]|nr:recombinase family protein [Roseovarius aestuarii]
MVQRVAIYARVSTGHQDTDRQVADLTALADRSGYRVVGIFTETASGRRDTRLERKKIMALAQRREIDAILVTELSRWGRSTTDLLSTLKELTAKGVSVKALNKSEFDLTTATGRAMVGVLAVISEFESDLLQERVLSGLERAKANGKVLGRKKGDAPKVKLYKSRVLKLRAEGRSFRWIAKELQIDPKTVAKIVHAHGAERSDTSRSAA